VKSIIAVLAVLAVSQPVTARAVDVWVTHSTEKIGATAAARAAGPARVSAARNEF
jgi:hypothetical protein